MKRLTEYGREILLYIVLPAVALVGIGFLSGYFAGRQRVPVVQYLSQPAPDREYVVRQQRAGMDEYIYILTKEYVTDIEFVAHGWMEGK